MVSNVAKLFRFMGDCKFAGLDKIAVFSTGVLVPAAIRKVYNEREGTFAKTIVVFRDNADKRKKQEVWELVLKDKVGTPRVFAVSNGTVPCEKCPLARPNTLCPIASRCVQYFKWAVGLPDKLTDVNIDIFADAIKRALGGDPRVK